MGDLTPQTLISLGMTISSFLYALFTFYKLYKESLANPLISEYEGDYDDHGKYSGFGELKISSGDRYRGYFENGEYHGLGEYYFSKDDVTYIGMFKNGQATGQCREMSKTGLCYQGGMLHGKKVTVGSVFTSSGETHVSSYHDDLKHGHSVVLLQGGSLLEGLCKHGKREGPWTGTSLVTTETKPVLVKTQ